MQMLTEHFPEVLHCLHEGLTKRLRNVETSATLIVLTLLDPRFKNVGFSSVVISDRAKNLVIDHL